MNLFFTKSETPFETIPFDQIKNEDFLPALKKAIEIENEEINEITNSEEKETFSNTIAALDNTGEALGKVSGVFFNLMYAETNDELQEIAKEFSPILTAHSNDILLNEKLFNRVQKIWDEKDRLNLSPEEMTLLEKKYKSFVRNGALLNDSQKEELRELDKKLSTLTLSFGENVLKATHAFNLDIDNADDLAGLPEYAVEAAKMTAQSKEKGENIWTFTLDYPSFSAFMTYSENRSLREKLLKEYVSKNFKDNDFNNEENVKEISALRYQRARLLGYNSHAHFVLEQSMAENPEKVMNFLQELLVKAKPHAIKEIEELKEFAHKLDGLAIDEFKPWDYPFYAEKIKKEKFQLDDETLKPYFKLENVLDGAFKVAEKLFDIRFKVRRDIPVYHEDVTTYEVQTLDGRHVGVFYADFFPRDGKSNGAWMTSYRDQKSDIKNEVRPHISIVCNFSKPTEHLPSLLTMNEVKTLFHEFGHALHGLLSNVRFQGLSGTNVYRDFVELPSQILENWVMEEECLDLFARHYETNERIPQDFIEKIKASSNFHEGRNTMRQLGFAFTDMAWHTGDTSEISSVSNFEEEASRETRILDKIPESNFSTSFSHIFNGGYSAGYYSYKWAEVLDADAFEYFKENGIFNKEIADSFKENILSKGGSEHPMTLYKRFRGQEPRVQALLNRGGLTS